MREAYRRKRRHAQNAARLGIGTRESSRGVFPRHIRLYLQACQVLPIDQRRAAGRDSRLFARIHWLIAAVLFGTCGWLHAGLLGGLGPLQIVSPAIEGTVFLLSLPVFIIVSYLFLFILNSIAARLTTFEATYRGIRLPRPVVMRALHYHAAHYLPVGLLGIAAVGWYKVFLLGWPVKAWRFEMTYLYVLCGAVVLSAVYLFRTYWVAMRNLMYANRAEPVDAAAK